jgi:hypothetical protein
VKPSGFFFLKDPAMRRIRRKEIMSKPKFSDTELELFDQRLKDDPAFNILYYKLHDEITDTQKGDIKSREKLADQLKDLSDKVYEFNGLLEKHRMAFQEELISINDRIATNKAATYALEELYKVQNRDHRELLLYLKGVFHGMKYDYVEDALQATLDRHIPET